MKSYISRFLHHTLSHSGIREVFTPSLSHSDLIGVSRSNKFAALSNLDIRVKPEYDNIGVDYRVKPDNDGLCTGRSMVEMLGVLAIIGVLSVGAIAGYSKAMMKYKLNQHAQAVNMLINNVLQLKGQLQHEPDTATAYGTLLHKLNLLPDGIIYHDDWNLTDMWFKKTIQIYYSNDIYTSSNGQQVQNDLGAISFNFDSNSNVGAEICRNIAFAAKENAANIWELQLYGSGQDYYGDAYCSKYYVCLRDLNLDLVDKLCNNCTADKCNLRILWKK